MNDRRRWLTLAFVLAGATGCASPRLALAPCAIEGVSGARCGTLEVAENRAHPSRRIGLRVVLLDATAPAPRSEPIVFLSGGPGQAVTDSIKRIAGDYAEARKNARLLFVDQRGTGGSNALPCRPFAADDMRRFFGDGADAEGLRRCREQLERHADLTQYTTAAFIDDLEDVRRAIGAARVDLDGGSYGTRVALEYIRRHPDRIRAAVLQGINPPDYTLPLPFASAGQRALDLWLDSGGRDIRAKLASVFTSLERAPASVSIVNPATQKETTVVVTRDRFAKYLHLLLLAQPLATRIPPLVDAAAGGDFKPFVELVVAITSQFGDLIAYGMQLSVTCAEDVPFIDEAAVERDRRETFLRDVRVREARQACAAWPRAEATPMREPVTAETPVLLLSGERDPVTPPDIAARVAARLPRSRLVVVPGGSHINNDPCLQDLVTRFLATADAKSLDVSCVSGIDKPAWPR